MLIFPCFSHCATEDVPPTRAPVRAPAAKLSEKIWHSPISMDDHLTFLAFSPLKMAITWGSLSIFETANITAMTFESSGGHAENGDEDQVKKWLETMTLGLAGLPWSHTAIPRSDLRGSRCVRSRKHRSTVGMSLLKITMDYQQTLNMIYK